MSVMASHRKMTTSIWEQSLKMILLKLHEKLPKNSTLTILQSFSIWSKQKRWKNSLSGCLMSWQKIKEIFILNCNHDGMITDLEPDILECEVKWALGSITMNQVTGWNSSCAISNPKRWCCESAAFNMSGSRWVITPSWLSGSWRSFLYNSSVYSCYLFLIFSASVRSIPFCLICAHLCMKCFLGISNFLKQSLVFPTLLFSSYFFTLIT